jgi:RNA polymerase sigma factor (sigma-70 family)
MSDDVPLDFATAWKEVEPAIARLCYRFAGSRDKADELLQRIRIRAWRGHSAFRGDGPYRAFVGIIARREGRDFAQERLKRQARELPYDPERNDITPASAAASHAATPKDLLDPVAADLDAANLVAPEPDPPDIDVDELIAAAERDRVLSSLESQVLRARACDEVDRSWDAIALRLGKSANHVAQLHARAIVKIRVYLFLARPDALGGLAIIARAFDDLQVGHRGPKLTPKESDAFSRAVLGRGPRGTRMAVSVGALRGACLKLIGRLRPPI